MKSFETYAERKSVIDPYASIAEPTARIRGPGRRRTLTDFGVLEISPFYGEHVRLARRFTHGGLSSVNIFVSHPGADHAEGLAELLQQLETARNKVDPYVEIGQHLRIKADSFEKRLGAELKKLAEQIESRYTDERKTPLDEFLQPVMQLERRGHIDAALDVLYDRMDALLKTKQFAAIDTLLHQANVDSLSIDVLLGLLTASLPARSQLPARSKFYAQAVTSIKRRGEWEDGLLDGLES